MASLKRRVAQLKFNLKLIRRRSLAGKLPGCREGEATKIGNVYLHQALMTEEPTQEREMIANTATYGFDCMTYFPGCKKFFVFWKALLFRPSCNDINIHPSGGGKAGVCTANKFRQFNSTKQFTLE